MTFFTENFRNISSLLEWYALTLNEAMDTMIDVDKP